MSFLSVTALDMQDKALFGEEARQRDQSYHVLQPHTVEETQTGTGGSETTHSYKMNQTSRQQEFGEVESKL